MKDQSKTKKQLIIELEELRRRIAEIGTLVEEHRQSEAALGQLAAIVQSSDDAIIGKSLEGIIVSWNLGAERIYGYPSSEVIGRHISILVPDNYPDETSEFLGRIGRGERIERLETMRRRKDGRQICVSLTISPVKDPTGTIVGASTIARDITQRKRSEDALRESESRYRAFFENSIDAVLITSPDGSIEEANAEACRTFGLTLEELKQVGRNGVSDASDPRLSAAIEERTQTGQFKGELNLKRGDGTLFPCEVSSAIFIDKTGLTKTSMIIRDITERKRMLKEQEDLILQLQKALDEVRTLRGILPICASCKKIRDDRGYWNQIESYIRDHSEAEFSHGLCPDCVKKLYPEFADRLKNNPGKR